VIASLPQIVQPGRTEAKVRGLTVVTYEDRSFSVHSKLDLLPDTTLLVESRLVLGAVDLEEQRRLTIRSEPVVPKSAP
jgi:hypothetical protein